jgi:hypothetical protein
MDLHHVYHVHYYLTHRWGVCHLLISFTMSQYWTSHFPQIQLYQTLKQYMRVLKLPSSPFNLKTRSSCPSPSSDSPFRPTGGIHNTVFIHFKSSDFPVLVIIRMWFECWDKTNFKYLLSISPRKFEPSPSSILCRWGQKVRICPSPSNLD